jgi:hypothetical protein
MLKPTLATVAHFINVVLVVVTTRGVVHKLHFVDGIDAARASRRLSLSPFVDRLSVECC